MSIEAVVDIFREGIILALRLGGPILILCMLVGIIVAIFQAATQVHEQSLGFILKMMVVLSFLSLGGSWVLRSLQEYTMKLFELMMM